MSDKIIDFYNQASASYSKRRYLGQPKSYPQFFFQRRRALTLALMDKLVAGRQNLKLLDVACADGVMSFALLERFPKLWAKIVGVDIAPKMIEAAKAYNQDPRLSFFVKDETPVETYDVVLGLGFITGTILTEEINFVKQHLSPNGFYLCTLPSKYSLKALLTIRHEAYRQDYWTYREYEQFLSRYFEIVSAEPYGLFIPLIWKWPRLARPVQALTDRLLRVLPGLYHEKIYLLKNRPA